MSESMINMIINYFIYSAITASFVIFILFVLDILSKGKQKEKDKAYAQFIEGVKTNKLETVKQFFRENDTPLNEYHENLTVKLDKKVNSQALTPLMYAASEGYSHIVKFLCDSGADVNVKVNKSEALHLAAMNNQFECVELLITNKANINTQDGQGQTPIMLGCSDDKMLQTLINKGADTSITDAQDETVMHKLIEKDGKGIHILLDSGIDINTVINKEKDSLLLAAIKFGHDATAKKLAKMGANIDQKDTNGTTSLLLAVDKNKADLVSEFVQHKTDINQYGSTLLHIAVKHKNEEIVKSLINSKIKMNEKDQDGRHALELAVESGTLSLIELLLANGAEVDKTGKDGNTILSTAAKANNQKLAELAIKHKADVNQFNSTLLHIAVIHDNTKLVKLLISKGIKVNEKNTDGESALELAVNHKNMEIITLLLDNGSKVDTVYKNGKTTLSTAVSAGDYVLAELCLKHGADINQKGSEGFGLLNVAIANNEIRLIELLTDYKVDTEVKNKAGQFPLEFAVVQENYELMDLLIKGGALKQENYLDIAINKNNANLVKALMDHGFKVENTNYFTALKNNYIEVFDLLCRAKKRTFHGKVHPLEITTMRETLSLNLEKVIVNTLGTELYYKLDNIGHLVGVLGDAMSISSFLGVKEINLHEFGQGIVVKVLNDSKEAKLISKLTIKNESVQLFDVTKINSTNYLLFYPVPGTSLKDWKREQEYIQNMLGRPIELEEYDRRHEIYSRDYYDGDLIIIKESALSAMTEELNLGGSFLKEEESGSRAVYIFDGVNDISLWRNSLDKISAYINKRVIIKSFDEHRGIIQLQESVEEALPRILDLSDNNVYPELLEVEERNGNTYYYYSFLPGIDLRVWKDRIKKKNLRVIFDEPEKVYEVEVFNKENPDYRAIKNENGTFILVKELAKIPKGDELLEILPTDILKDEMIFWGYGSGSSQYHTSLSDAAHMMVIGGTGSGKSNFMNGIILSLLHNIKHIEKLYLIDLKSGVEFNKYMDLDSKKVEVFSRGTKPTTLLAALLEVEAEMYLRNEYMAANRLTKISDAPIYLIIDEYAQIEVMPAIEMEERKAKSAILDTLLKIGSLARAANIKLFVQTQDPNKVETDLKKHLMSRALLKTGNARDSSTTLQQADKLDEMGIEHTAFGKGRYVFEDYNEGDTKLTELQFPFIDPDKEYHMQYKKAAKIIDDTFEEKLAPLIPSVRTAYQHLQETSRLRDSHTSSLQKESKEITNLQDITQQSQSVSNRNHESPEKPLIKNDVTEKAEKDIVQSIDEQTSKIDALLASLN